MAPNNSLPHSQPLLPLLLSSLPKLRPPPLSQEQGSATSPRCVHSPMRVTASRRWHCSSTSWSSASVLFP